MADEKNYSSKPLLYVSRGLDARHAPDRVPEGGYFINLLNGFEREESAMSSRYGTQIINRDPYGTTPPAQNYFFTSPVTSLARLAYTNGSGSNIYRYAGLADGTLWRRAGNSQGAFSQVYSGLSGSPFQSIVTNCYETAQAYIFIADAAASIKDLGTGSPQLWGIDPSPYTANSLPYSPLLTLVDSFSASNTYAASGFSVAWAYESIATISAGNGQLVTDFPQFNNLGSTVYTVGSSSATATQAAAVGTDTVLATSSGFPSVAITPGETVGLTLLLTGSWASSSTGAGTGVSHTPWARLMPPIRSHSVVMARISDCMTPGASSLRARRDG